MQVAHVGGAYISHTIAHGSEDQKRLLAINRRLLKAVGLEKGATHAEFIKSAADGKFYFSNCQSYWWCLHCRSVGSRHGRKSLARVGQS